MSPKSQRSRACNQCRKRRVKCDETPGVCAQCRRLGMKCSGPVQGSVIIDMTERVSKPCQRKKKDVKANAMTRKNSIQDTPVRVVELPKSKTASEETQRTTSLPTPASNQQKNLESSSNCGHRSLLAVDQKLRSGLQQADEAFAAIRNAFRLSILYQPSKMRIEDLDVVFVSHFVELNKHARPCSPRVPWLTYLPELHKAADRPALRLSIRAASMACYAQVHRDPAILVDSYRWYTVSLSCQRLSISMIGKDKVPSAEEILVPIILSIYEVYVGTTATSVLQHLSGAVKILEMRGPRECRSGVVGSLFKALRVSDAHKALFSCQPSVFSTRAWLDIPFDGQPRNAHQSMIDIMLAVPGCINLCKINGSLRTVFSTPLSPGLDRNTGRERTLQLIWDLEEWAAKHPYLAKAAQTNRFVAAKPTNPATGVTLSKNPNPTPVMLPDSFVCMVLANYEALRLVLYLLLEKFSSDSGDPTLSPYSSVSAPVERAMMSSKAVLEITAYIESAHPVGFDFMRSAFALAVVSALGPRKKQQAAARTMLKEWGKKRGMVGLSSAWLHV